MEYFSSDYFYLLGECASVIAAIGHAAWCVFYSPFLEANPEMGGQSLPCQFYSFTWLCLDTGHPGSPSSHPRLYRLGAENPRHPQPDLHRGRLVTLERDEMVAVSAPIPLRPTLDDPDLFHHHIPSRVMSQKGMV